MNELRRILLEEIGSYSVDVSTTGECAPSSSLIAAVDSYEAALVELELEYNDYRKGATAGLRALVKENAEMKAVLGRVKACAKIYLSQYEGVYDMAIPEPFQSPDAKRAETNLRTILSQSPEVLAVVDGYKLEALDWPFIVQEECGDALLGIWETEPSEGWTNTPVTAIIIKKGGTA